MDFFTRGLKRFERHWIRPLARGIRGFPSKPGPTERRPEDERLEELLVALLRADLRRQRSALPDDNTLLPAAHRPAGQQANELDGLLTALLDMEPTERA